MKLNRSQKRELAKAQTKNAVALTYERQKIQREKKDLFLKLPWYNRLKMFYEKLPTSKAKKVFWILSPLVFGLFIPIHFVISICKLDVAWTWSGQILYSFKNGK